MYTIGTEISSLSVTATVNFKDEGFILSLLDSQPADKPVSFFVSEQESKRVTVALVSATHRLE